MNRHGLHICLADANAEALKTAEILIADIAGPENVLAVATDVSNLEQVQHLRDEAMAKFGEASIIHGRPPVPRRMLNRSPYLFPLHQVNVLLHAAAIGTAHDGSTGTSFENITAWKEVLDVNLGGVCHYYLRTERG